MHRNKIKARSAFDLFLLVSAGILVAGFISTLVILGNLSLGNLSTSSSSSAAPVYSFAVVGDFGATANTTSVLQTIKSSNTAYTLAIGDMSYGDKVPESGWCNYVKGIVGVTYPFEVFTSNHDDHLIEAYDRNNNTGDIDKFAACLPHRAGTLSGSYGWQYYIDYPSQSPLVRHILLPTNMSRRNASGSLTKITYTKNSANYNWVASTIDAARAQGIKWITVSTSLDCVHIESQSCRYGADLANLLFEKKVDVLMDGHVHSYHRTKQIALNPSTCPSIAASGFQNYDPDCIVDNGADNVYSKGKGAVSLLLGTGGKSVRFSGVDPDVKDYFVKWFGDTYGIGKFSVSENELEFKFIASAGSGKTDCFKITSVQPAGTYNCASSTPSPETPAPSLSPAPGTCAISSAQWITPAEPVTKGTTVQLKVNTLGECTGKQVNFTVWEHDQDTPSDRAAIQPGPASVSDSVAIGTWVTELPGDGNTSPEFYFEANISGQTEKTRSNNPLLSVVPTLASPSPSPSPSTSPSPCNGTSLFTYTTPEEYNFTTGCINTGTQIYTDDTRFTFFFLPDYLKNIPFIKTGNLAEKDDPDFSFNIAFKQNAQVYIMYRKIPGQIPPLWLTEQYTRISPEGYENLLLFTLRKNTDGLIGVYDIYRSNQNYSSGGAAELGPASDPGNTAFSMYITGIKPL